MSSIFLLLSSICLHLSSLSLSLSPPPCPALLSVAALHRQGRAGKVRDKRGSSTPTASGTPRAASFSPRCWCALWCVVCGVWCVVSDAARRGIGKAAAKMGWRDTVCGSSHTCLSGVSCFLFFFLPPLLSHLPSLLAFFSHSILAHRERSRVRGTQWRR